MRVSQSSKSRHPITARVANLTARVAVYPSRPRHRPHPVAGRALGHLFVDVHQPLGRHGYCRKRFASRRISAWRPCSCSIRLGFSWFVTSASDDGSGHPVMPQRQWKSAFERPIRSTDARGLSAEPMLRRTAPGHAPRPEHRPLRSSGTRAAAGARVPALAFVNLRDGSSPSHRPARKLLSTRTPRT